MGLEIPLLREGSGAEGTGMGLLARVLDHVGLQRPLLVESFSTLAAFKWPFTYREEKDHGVSTLGLQRDTHKLLQIKSPTYLRSQNCSPESYTQTHNCLLNTLKSNMSQTEPLTISHQGHPSSLGPGTPSEGLLLPTLHVLAAASASAPAQPHGRTAAPCLQELPSTQQTEEPFLELSQANRLGPMPPSLTPTPSSLWLIPQHNRQLQWP